jgi:hypothetical protein
LARWCPDQPHKGVEQMEIQILESREADAQRFCIIFGDNG